MLTLRLQPKVRRLLEKQAGATGKSVNALVADLIARELGLTDSKKGK